MRWVWRSPAGPPSTTRRFCTPTTWPDPLDGPNYAGTRVQDRDGAKPVLLDTFLRTRVRFVFADGGFAGRVLDWANTTLRTTLHIVRKPADQRGFVVIPRRWAVERTFGWLIAHRRLARDYERHPAHSEAMIRWAAINTITRRTARGEPATRQQKRVFTTST